MEKSGVLLHLCCNVMCLCLTHYNFFFPDLSCWAPRKAAERSRQPLFLKFCPAAILYGAVSREDISSSKTLLLIVLQYKDVVTWAFFCIGQSLHLHFSSLSALLHCPLPRVFQRRSVRTAEQTEQEQKTPKCSLLHKKLRLLGLSSHRLVAQDEEKALGRHSDENSRMKTEVRRQSSTEIT